jgi:hypothetical protein
MTHLYEITFSDGEAIQVTERDIGSALHKAWLMVYTEQGKDREVIKIERTQ